MTLTQFTNYISYSTIRPDRITTARWNGMIKYAKKNGIISWIAIDKLIKIVYNTDMTNNNNTNERREIMKSLKEIITSYPVKVASQMDRGLTIESDQIAEIANVLRKLGNSRGFHQRRFRLLP